MKKVSKREHLKVLQKNKKLEKKVEDLTAALKKSEAEKEAWIAMYNALLLERYKKSSEAVKKDPEQKPFDEAENEAGGGAAEEEKENGNKEPVDKKRVRKYVRHKSHNSKIDAPSDTPITTEKIEFKGGCCPDCGCDLEFKEYKAVDRIMKYTITAIVRTQVPVGHCKFCGKDTEQESSDILLDSACDSSFLANVITAKMRDGLPLYRQEGELIPGVTVTRQLLSSWIMNTGYKLTENLIPMLEEEVMSQPLVNCDETTVKVITLKDEEGKSKAPNSRSNAFMIVRVGVGSNGKKGPVIFNYSDNRKNDTIAELVKGFKGCLQTDGLKQYANANKDGEFTHLGCLVHARRHAVKAQGNRTSGKAKEIVDKYGLIFHEEGLLKDLYDSGQLTEDEYLIKRKEKLLPLFEDLKKFMQEILSADAKPGKALENACKYFIDRYDELIRFLDYSFATSSNQVSENAIRPFTIGRKNFLFCFTELGAEVSAAYYSLVQSCLNLGIDPEDYLTYLFRNAGGVKDGDREGWRALLPGHCDVSEGRKYREMLRSAKPDPNRKENYILRGRRVKA